MAKRLVIGLVLVSCGGLLGACGSFAAVKKGECNSGRTWVAPEKVDGKWKDGYCKNN